MKTQNRDKAIDIAKGIGILLVIIGHTGGLPTDYYIHHFIYSFHMPLFFIFGGFLFKYSSIRTHIWKDAKRLILPYVFTLFLLVLFYIILGIKYDNYGMVWRTIQAGAFGSGQYHNSPIWGDFPTIGMTWFLLAMFWCRVTYNIISKLPTLHKFLISAFIAISAIVIDNFIINMPFGILTGLSAIIFYMLGNALKENLTWIHKKRTMFSVIGTVCWILALLFSGMGMAICHYENYLLDIAGACGATWCVYRFSRQLEKRTCCLNSVLSWFGANSMTILCAHFLEESSFLWDHLHVPTDWYVILPLRIFFIIIFTFIASRFAFLRKIYNII